MECLPPAYDKVECHIETSHYLVPVFLGRQGYFV